MFKSHDDKLTIAKIEATLNDVPDEIKGFPTIKMYPAGKKDAPVEYNGDRSIESLIEFIKTAGTHQLEPQDPDVDMEDATETLGVAAKAASKVAEVIKDAVLEDADDIVARDEL